jgi:hypothetical protein
MIGPPKYIFQGLQRSRIGGGSQFESNHQRRFESFSYRGFVAENGQNQGTAHAEHVVFDNVVEGVDLITAQFRFSQGVGIWLISFIN